MITVNIKHHHSFKIFIMKIMKAPQSYMYFLYCLLLLCLSCKKEIVIERESSKANLEQEFIKENFLEIVDTIAYSKGAFITTASDSISYPRLSVRLSHRIDYNEGLEEFTNAYFAKNKDVSIIFKDVIKKKNYSIITLDSNFPKNIGKYYFFFDDNQQDKTIKYAGRIDIENFKIYKDKAILILTKSLGRYGASYVIMLIKENGNWRIYKREVLLIS